MLCALLLMVGLCFIVDGLHAVDVQYSAEFQSHTNADASHKNLGFNFREINF